MTATERGALTGAPTPTRTTTRGIGVQIFAEPYPEWASVLREPEVASLLKMRKAAAAVGFPGGAFPHIIGLHEVFRDGANHTLHMVFEFAQWDLYKMIDGMLKSSRPRSKFPLATDNPLENT